MRDYRLHLSDILSAMESIESFVKGMNLETFQIDDKTTSAVIRKNVSPKLNNRLRRCWNTWLNPEYHWTESFVNPNSHVFD